MYDAIVVGGGIVGMSVAYHLVRRGAKILLMDRADVGKATLAGAGILSPETSSLGSTSWYDLAVAAVDYYPTLVEQLQADGAGDCGYAAVRALVVAVSEDEDAAFLALEQNIRVRREIVNRLALDDIARIDAETAHRIFPPLGSVRHALLVQHAGRVDGRLMTAALRNAAVGRGLEIREGSVSGLVIREGATCGVASDGEEISTGTGVIAGGAWSGEFARQLGVALPIQPQRGQIIHLALPDTDTTDFPIVLAFHGHYIVPWDDHRVVIGATREWVGFNPQITAAGVFQVLEEALRVAPSLAEATISDIRIGLRPGTPDHLPVLGPVPTLRNVYLATGHGATGLQLGPYSGKLVAELVLGESSPVNLEAFSAMRFPLNP